MPPKTPKIAAVIDAALKRRGSNWSQLADTLNENKQTVHYWKKTGNFPVEQLKQIGDYAGIDALRLFALRFDLKMPDGSAVISDDARQIAEQFDQLPKEAQLLVHMWLDSLRGLVKTRQFDPPNKAK